MELNEFEFEVSHNYFSYMEQSFILPLVVRNFPPTNKYSSFILAMNQLK